MEYRLLQPKDAVCQLKNPHPVFLSQITINPYVGCSYGCPYCYGLKDDEITDTYSPKIGVKTNLPAQLKQKLTSSPHLPIMLGSTTDPYQPLEEELKITQACIELIAENKVPLQIFTKSSLILRDIDIISRHSKTGLCAVNITLFTLDESIKSIFEPQAPSIESRIKLISKLKEKEIIVGVALIPIIPYINGDIEKISQLIKTIKKHGADYLIPACLVLKPTVVCQRISGLLNRQFTKIVHKYNALYEQGHLPKVTYSNRITKEIIQIAEKNNMPLQVPVSGTSSIDDIRMEPIR